MDYVLLDEQGAVAQYPYSIGQLRRDNPDTSFPAEPGPECLAGFHVAPVEPSPAPETKPIERASPASPVLQDDVWTQQWEVETLPLEEARAALWEVAKQNREEGVRAAVTVAGIGTFDADAKSQAYINGAVTMALIAHIAGKPFAMNWKLADNTIVALDGPKMIAVGEAVGRGIAAVHAKAQAIGIAVQAAKDTSDLAKIEIDEVRP